MNKSAAEIAEALWRSDLRQLIEEQKWEKWRETVRLRDFFFKLHAVIKSTPPNILQEFSTFAETELISCAHDQMRFDFTPRLATQDASARELLFAASVLLRTVDELLLEANEVAPSSGANSWLTTCKKAYILPMSRSVISGKGAKTGQSFHRRGWLRHRIIPTSVEDVDVVIIRHPDLSLNDAPDHRRIGAALFPGFELETQDFVDKSFVVRSVFSKNGIEKDVTEHLKEARTHDCDTIIWPELTIEPAVSLQIRKLLANDPLRAAFVPLVVAGSWHTCENGIFRNHATVLTGQGRPLFRFGKSRKFMMGDQTEAIEPCGKIHIAMTDRDLIGFAICKDFCDLASPVAAKELDVDLFVVPSMGGWTTMAAHLNAANEVRVRHGARSAVVQQTFPRTSADPTGYILPALNKPSEINEKGLECNDRFTIFHSGG